MNRDNITLDKELEAIWRVMKDKGLVTDQMEDHKDELLNGVKEALENEGIENLSAHELKNENIQKLLIGAIISVTLGLKENTAELAKTIGKVRNDEVDPKLQDTIDNQLKAGLNLLKLLIAFPDPNKKNDLTPRPEPGPTLKEELEQKLDPTDPADEKKKEKVEEEMREFEKQLDDSLRNLNGGEDPRLSGKIPSIITGPIAGNLFSFTHQAAPDPNSVSEMVMEVTYNADRSDDQGMENTLAVDDLMSDVVDSVMSEVMRVDTTPTLTKS